MRISIGVLALAVVAVPARGDGRLENWSFEDDLASWTYVNVSINPSQCIPEPAYLHGTKRAGDGTCNSRSSQAYQTVTHPDLDGEVKLTGGLAGGNDGGSYYWVRLRSGGIDGTVLDSIAISGVHNWNYFELAGTSSGMVTVEFGCTGDGAWGPAGYHVDALVLTPEPSSLGLLGLAGLPFLLRRRCTA